jgi:RHS repeat-associated protein
MKLLFPLPVKHLYRLSVFCITLLLFKSSVKAQCESDLYLSSDPYILCSPQTVTFTTELNYWGPQALTWGVVNWYNQETGGQPFASQAINTYDYDIYINQDVYAENGKTIWVSYYDNWTGCETQRMAYTFEVIASTPPPTLYQEYAFLCGTVAKIKVSSNNNPSGLFTLYRQSNSGNIEYVNQNATGYFEIANYDPNYSYAISGGQTSVCMSPSYFWIVFENVFSLDPPSVIGNFTVVSGSSTTLTAGGDNFSNFRWYNSANTIVGQGSSYTTPLLTESADYHVEGYYTDGTGCTSNAAWFTINVTAPPPPPPVCNNEMQVSLKDPLVICSPQWVTLTASMYNPSAPGVFSGSIKWYYTETGGQPFEEDLISMSTQEEISSSTTNEIDVNTHPTIWVTYYNTSTQCEAPRLAYTIPITPMPDWDIEYVHACGKVGKLKLTSNSSNLTYYLYKENSDGGYSLINFNSTGIFEFNDFDPNSLYFVRVASSTGCNSGMLQVVFDDFDPSTPDISGNITPVNGTSTTLTASGNEYFYNWYDGNGNFLYYGAEFTTPVLSDKTYTYQVRAVTEDAVCLGDPLTVTVTADVPTITYGLLYNSVNFTRTVDFTKPVGTVKGGLGTTSTGAVSYSIPIVTPPGTNGVSPSVSICYNSQATNGTVGYGWNISGLSAVGRQGKNLFNDGVVSPVTYTDKDVFVIDGNRLNPVSGANGANGTIYAQDAERFAKIVSNGPSASNPDWFQVITKDGSIMEYGHSTDSRVLTDDGASVVLWRLNKIIDVNGNYVEFTYLNGYRDSRIDEINYTGNDNTSLLPYNKIKFNYDVRSDVATTYVNGASFTAKHILKSIVVTSEGNKVKTYEFNYGFDNLYSLLKEVTEKGSDDVALNSTIFLYGGTPPGIEVQHIGTLLQGQYDLYTGDFNADGRTDLMACGVIYSLGARLHTNYYIKTDITPNGSEALYSKTIDAGDVVNTHNRTSNFLSNDYDGDGRDDAIEVNTVVGEAGYGDLAGYSTLKNVRINKTTSNNAAGFESIVYTYPFRDNLSNIIEPTYRNFLIPGDFDGDGNQDFITILGSVPAYPNNNDPSDIAYEAFFNSPSTISNQLTRLIYPFGIGPDPGGIKGTNTIAEAKVIMPIDFDGDGKQELLVAKPDGCHIFSIQKTVYSPDETDFSAKEVYTGKDIYDVYLIYPGDFNGDSKTDMLIKYPGGAWNILYSTGVGFITRPFSFSKVPNITGSNTDDKISISDFNDDGKSDILHGYNLGDGTAKLALYYSKGNNDGGFLYQEYDYANKLATGDEIGFVVGDFNGDGKSDILNRFGDSQNGTDLIYFNAFAKERLLAKVTDGHNVTSSFDYKLLTDYDNNTSPSIYTRTVSPDDPANKNPFNYVQLPMYVVSSFTNTDGIGGLNTTNLTYEDAVVHRSAKGLLGFKKVVVKDAAAGITTTTENNFDLQFAVPYTTRQSMTMTASNTLLSENLTRVSFTGLSTGSTDLKRFKQQTDNILKLDYLTGRGINTAYLYDNYGNVNSTVVTTGAFSGIVVTPTHTTTTIASYGTFNSPVPARVTSSTVMEERNGSAAQSRVTAYTYTANGLPNTKTDFSGQTKAVTTTYAYDQFGNVSSTTINTAGLNSRVATILYDAKGRLPVTKQQIGSGLTQTESTTYDFKFGVPISQTSTDCLTSTFEYDGFGRLKNTIMPTGYSVATSMVWDMTGNKVYYTKAHYSGGKADVSTWYDRLGRELVKQSVGFNGQLLTQETTYDARGNVLTKTNPYYTTEIPVTTTNTYDDYNRLVSASNAFKTINNTYNKLADGMQEVVVTDAGQTTSAITDATGKMISTQDKGGQLTFSYDSWGNQTQVKHNGTIIKENYYDSYGRQTSAVDKNSGTMTYEYDAFGQLKTQTDANGNTYNMLYDDFGRIINRQGPEGTTTYEYYKNASGTCSNDNPVKITGFNGITDEYTFDNFNRVQTETTTIDGIPYKTIYDHDAYGNITKITYPSGVVVNNVYDNYGNLITVTGGDDAAPVNLFTGNSMNGFGQYTNYTLGNNKNSVNTYTYGFPVQFKTAGIQDLNFNFDYAKGNLMSRTDAVKNITETFSYDDLNRLTNATVNNVSQLTMGYDGDNSFSRGNIMSKTDAGNYVYKNDKINAVAYITNPAGDMANPVTISTLEQQITFTPFLKADRITENNYQLDYVYGSDYERAKSILQQNNNLIETKYYLGNYEKQISGGVTREIHYVSGGNGMCAIIEREGGVNNFYFVYTDYLGSILTLTDINGSVVAEQNFDAWGRNRNATTWQYGTATPVPVWLYRGYTGHEHLKQFALINMNARLYDPIQGRMLSADNYTGTGTQGYNRYSYANNNPLKYTDPDGNFGILAVLAQAVIGAGTSAAIYSLSAGNKWNWHGFLAALETGAVSGAVGNSVGELGHDLFKVSSTSLGSSIASNIAGQVGTSIITANHITAGMLVGSIAGELVNDQFGYWTGVKGTGIGGIVENIIGEFAFNVEKFAVSGAASGFVSDLVNGGSGAEGAQQGLKIGARSGVVATELNILTMGPSYVPVRKFKSYGDDNPVFRTGYTLVRLFIKKGGGVTLGRNLVTQQRTGFDEKNAALQEHEFGHYVDIMRLGEGEFYQRIYKEYIRYGPVNVYSTVGTMEWSAQMYTGWRLGYYVDVNDYIVPFY